MIIKWKKYIYGNQSLVAFVFLSITLGTASGMMQFELPLYMVHLHVNDAGVGLIRGIAQLGGLLMTLPSGILVDRFGSRRIFLIGSFLNSFILMLLMGATGVKNLVILLFLDGVIKMLGWNALNSAFIRRIDSYGHGKAGWVRASSSIGMNFLGPLIAGNVFGLTHFSLAFFVSGMLLLFLVFLIIVASDKRGAQKRVKYKSLLKNDTHFVTELKKLIKNPLLISSALVQSVGIGCWTSVTVFILVFVVDTLKFSSRVAASIASTQGIGFILTMFFGGFLIKRIGINKAYILGFSLQLFGLLAIGLGDFLGVIWIGATIHSMGTGLLTTISYGILSKINGDKGKVSGVFYTITGAGIGLGPIFGGYLSLWLGIRAAFLGFIPLIVIVLFNMIWNTSLKGWMGINFQVSKKSVV